MSTIESTLSSAPAVRRPLVMVALLVGSFTAVMNMSVTNVALPIIAADLDANGSEIAWISDAFTIALTSFVLLSGAIGDRYGRRRLFLLGAVLVMPTSVAAAAAGDATTLISARALTGLAVALLFPTTLSFITTLYPEPGERTKAIGLWAGVASAGAALGPVIGGVLLEHFWWGSVFLIGLPIAGVAAVLGWFSLPRDGGADDHVVDWAGGVMSIVFAASLLYTIIELPIHGLDGRVSTAAIVAVVSGALFARHQLTVDHPLLDLRTFRRPRFGLAALTVAVVFFASFGYAFLSAQFLQTVLGYSPLSAGVATLPTSVGMLVMSQVAGRLDRPWGTNRVMAAGLVVMAAAFGLAALWDVDVPYGPIGIGMFLVGAGVGLAAAPSTDAIMSSLPPEQAGVGSAVNDVTREFGGALGIALFGAVSSVFYGRYIERLFTSLPDDVQQQVSDDVVLTVSRSLNGALAVAERYSEQYPAESASVVRAASQGWVDGQGAAMTMGAVSCVVLAAIVWRFMPRAQADCAQAD